MYELFILWFEIHYWSAPRPFLPTDTIYMDNEYHNISFQLSGPNQWISRKLQTMFHMKSLRCFLLWVLPLVPSLAGPWAHHPPVGAYKEAALSGGGTAEWCGAHGPCHHCAARYCCPSDTCREVRRGSPVTSGRQQGRHSRKAGCCEQERPAA